MGSKFDAISSYCDKYITWFSQLIIKNLKKGENPDELKIENYVKRENDGEEDDDLINYLELFSEELLLKQYMNVLIGEGKPEYYSDITKEDIRKENIKFIRKNSDKLSDRQLFDDEKAGKITFEKIWSRLSTLGFNSTVADNIVKNIAKANPKTMDEGVHNLINAVYIACMI